MARRVGAFNRARKRGLSIAEARAYSDRLYPPTVEDTAYEGRDWVINEFRKHAKKIQSTDAANQTAFSIILATYWKAFLAQHGSPTKFARLPRNAQMNYYKKWLSLCATLQKANDTERLVPAEIISYYLAAIISKDRALEIEIAKFGDKYAPEGWDVV